MDWLTKQAKFAEISAATTRCKGDRMTSFDATLQASGGKFDGWYLDFSDKPEQIEQGRFKYETYRVTLSEKPGPRTKLYIFIDGP